MEVQSQCRDQLMKRTFIRSYRTSLFCLMRSVIVFVKLFYNAGV